MVSTTENVMAISPGVFDRSAPSQLNLNSKLDEVGDEFTLQKLDVWLTTTSPSPLYMLDYLLDCHFYNMAPGDKHR